MATVQTIDAQTLGARFTADLTRSGIDVRELWYRDLDATGELWLVTDPVTYDDTRVISRVFVDVRRAFPGQHLRYYVLNPNDFGNGVPTSPVPAGAVRLDSHSHA